jgi:hypothetical protein
MTTINYQTLTTMWFSIIGRQSQADLKQNEKASSSYQTDSPNHSSWYQPNGSSVEVLSDVLRRTRM